MLLAHYGKNGKAEPVIPQIGRETLAEMIGTTPGRVSVFPVNSFRQLGLIEYNGGLLVHNSLLNMVLHDWLLQEARFPHVLNIEQIAIVGSANFLGGPPRQTAPLENKSSASS